VVTTSIIVPPKPSIKQMIIIGEDLDPLARVYRSFENTDPRIPSMTKINQGTQEWPRDIF
jgi:hypothetical protein